MPLASHSQSDPALRDLEVRKGSYCLRMASSPEDLEAACRLRFEIFNLELGEGLERSYATGLDADRYDEQCHHLIVESSDGVVGTYRLQAREQADPAHGFYSANEFQIETLPDEFLDHAVELGRACIAAPHRNRAVLLLLWKGLRSFMRATQKRYFFGCNSLTTQDADLAWATYQFLTERGHAHPEFRVKPTPNWVCERPADVLGPPPAVKIPPLFAAYLRYGSQICSEPAIDREFGTIDFLTVHDLAAADPVELARVR